MSAIVLQISYSLANIENAAHQFLQYLHKYRVAAFSGDLGAGKTTFIHALCDILGVEDAVSSPTFALINEYRFMQAGKEHIIHHMDWYRLRDEEEAINAGMDDAISQKDNYSLIEWPEKAPGILPYPHLAVYIRTTGPEQREMEVQLREK